VQSRKDLLIKKKKRTLSFKDKKRKTRKRKDAAESKP